jgi:hypothetical protein
LEKGKGKEMSSRALAWAWMQEIKYQMKFILIALADRADEFGICWPGLKWIHAKTGMSIGAVQSNIRKLAEAGLLEVTNRKRNDGSLTSNLYRLCIPGEFALSKKQRTAPQVDLDSEDLDRGISESDSHYTPNYTSKEKEEIKRPTFVSIEIWNEWLKHRKRKKAAVTPLVVKQITKVLGELEALGHSPDEVLTEAITRNWIGLKVDWIHKPKGNGYQQQREGDLSERTKRILRRGL